MAGAAQFKKMKYPVNLLCTPNLTEPNMVGLI